MKATIEKYELEVVEVMHLVQLQKKKIEALKIYKELYNQLIERVANAKAKQDLA